MVKARVSAEVYKAIGRISVAFNELEMLLRVCIGVMVSTDSDKGMVVTSQMPFRQLRDTFVQLYRRRFGMDMTKLGSKQKREWLEFSQMVTLIEEAERERNSILHSVWDPVAGEDTALGQKWSSYSRKWYQPTFMKRSASDLNAIADRVEAVSAELEKLYNVLFVEAYIKGRPGGSRL